MRQQRALREPGLDQAPQSAEGALGSADGIAILGIGSGVVTEPNPIDLSGYRLSIVPSADGVRVDSAATDAGPPVTDAGLRLELQDDDFAVIQLPFEFPFYGESHRTAYVQSDGHLTFRSPEFSSGLRNLSTAIGGPPRIAPFYRDLDPSRGGSVRFRSGSDSATVTWYRLPVYTDDVVGPQQTFQATLHADGRIEFRYGVLDPIDVQVEGAVPGAVVGVFPGDPLLGTEPVDWTAPESRMVAAPGAVAEVFSDERQLDEFGVIQAFLAGHEDAFDQLVIFNDIGLPAGRFSLAHAFTIRNEARGIGRIFFGQDSFDFGATFGSARRLSAIVNMGNVDPLPAGPYQDLDSARGLTTVTLLAHEVGHRFLAYPNFIDPATGMQSDAILGRQLSHWSFYFNSNASVLEGNAIRDRGPAARPRFETIAVTQTYSPFDQYLMGFREPRDVPDSFVVVPPQVGGRFTGAGPPVRGPQVGVTFDGTRKRVRVDDIIAAHGERRPDTTVAQRVFRLAFLLVVEDPDNVNPASIAKLQRLRAAWPDYFRRHLRNVASAEMDLVKMLHLSTWPAGGVVAGSPGRARVEIAAPRQTDLAVDLTFEEAIATVPATVTIPAGELHADFEISGTDAGVTTFSAAAREPGYDRPMTRFVVREGFDGLSVGTDSFGLAVGFAGMPLDEPVTFRVRDENLVHYSGVELGFRGSVPPPAAILNTRTDPNGEVSVRWTLGRGPIDQTLTAYLARAPEIQAQERAFAASEDLAISGAVNAASRVAPAPGEGFAPGSLVALLGSGFVSAEALSMGSETVPQPFLQAVLRGIQVFVAGVEAPLVSAMPGELTFQVPYGVSGPEVPLLVVWRRGSRSAPFTLPIGPAQPGIFPDRVAVAGDGFLEVRCTGLGEVTPAGRTGFPASQGLTRAVVAEVAAWVDGERAPVVSSQLSTEQAGVYVVRARLASRLSPGTHTVRIAAAGRESNEVSFEVE